MADPALNGAAGAAGEPIRWVLLAGGLQASPLGQSIDGSILDLLLAPDLTVLERWLSIIAASAAAGRPDGVWVVYGGQSPRPAEPRNAHAIPVHITHDPKSVRGPAGIAKDIAADWPESSLVMISEGKRCLTGQIGAMIHEHRQRNADVTVAANPDGSPAGMYLVRRRWLDLAPSAGFMDLKEQWLRKVHDRKGDVRVHRLAGRGSMPLRSREHFLAAAMALAGVSPDGRLSRFTIFGTEGANSEAPFNVFGRGAAVGAGAVVRDSVLMEEATVGAGAVVVRSIVMAGTAIQPGAEVVDAVVTARGVLSAAGVRFGSEKNPVRA